MFTILLRCESRILWSSSLLSVSIFPPSLASLSIQKMMRLDFNLKIFDDFLSILLGLPLHPEDDEVGFQFEELWWFLIYSPWPASPSGKFSCNMWNSKQESEWSAFGLCSEWAEARGYTTARTSRPDTYRCNFSDYIKLYISWQRINFHKASMFQGCKPDS